MANEIGGPVVLDLQDSLKNAVVHYKLPFSGASAADKTALQNGMAIPGYVPINGDYIYDAWFEITAAFDGTTPKADILFATKSGLFVTYAAGVCDLTKADADGGATNTKALNTNKHLLAAAVGPLAVTNTDASLLVVGSQTGLAGGLKLDSTAGSAIAHILIVPAFY